MRLPLRGREPQGVLAVAARRARADARNALESLAGELGMALETAGLERAARPPRRRRLVPLADRERERRDHRPRARRHDPLPVALDRGVIGCSPGRWSARARPTSCIPTTGSGRRRSTAAAERPGPSDHTMLVRWRHRDGGYRRVENRHANLLDDPAVGGVVLNSRDVTDRVRSRSSSRGARSTTG